METCNRSESAESGDHPLLQPPLFIQLLSTRSRLLSARCELMTTPYVLAECGNAVARTTFRRDVVELKEKLEADGKLIFPTEAD